MTGIGAGYKMESQEARALASITVDSYDYRDQGKLLSKLTNDVSYLAQYSRQMQKGIDSANSNFIEQITDFINEITTVIGGFGNTGIDLGDLKYVLQAFGALFGFNTETGLAGALPINLIDAAWHFIKSYVLGTDAETPGEYFDWLIDRILATALDWLGEIPIVGEAVETIAMWVTQFRDVIKATVTLLLSWSTPILEAIKSTTDFLGGLFGAWTEPIVTFVLSVVNWVSEIFSGWTGAIVQWIYSSVSWLSDIFGAWTGPIVTWVYNSLNGLMEVFGDRSVAIANWVRATLTWLAETFEAWTAPIAQWVTEVVQFVSDVFGDWSAAIAQWIHDSVAWLTDIFEDWTAPIVAGVRAVVDFVNAAFGDWSASIAAWIHDTVTWLSDMFEAWDGPFANMVKGAIAAIQQIVDWFTGTVGAAFEMLFPWAKKLPQMQIVNGQEVLKTTNVPSLDASKIGSGTLNSGLIASGSLDGSKLSDGAVTAPKLSDYAVSNTKLADYAISSNKLGQDPVTNYAIATNAVTSNEIYPNTITATEIATDAIGTSELADYAVATSNIQDSAVTGGKTTSLDGSKISGGLISVNVLPTDAIGQKLSTTGSGAMLVRSSTGAQSVTPNVGPQVIPSGFFNTYSRKSADINILGGYTGLQVTLGGWYMVEIAYKVNANASWGWGLAPVLFVNGGAAKYGTDCMYTWFGVASPGWQRYVQNSFIVYLDAYHYVQAGYDCAMGAAANSDVLGGGNGSSDTYFSISLLNRSYA